MTREKLIASTRDLTTEALEMILSRDLAARMEGRIPGIKTPASLRVGKRVDPATPRQSSKRRPEPGRRAPTTGQRRPSRYALQGRLARAGEWRGA